jgi:LysR family nitrogen assimilation transcriptional regulator
VGVALFVRHRRGMELTEGGQRLLSHVSGLIRQLEQAYDDVRSSDTHISGEVVFGIVPTVSYILAAPLVRRAAKQFPALAARGERLETE